jgi:predicted amidophosphoribosyltransferase
MKSVDSYDGKRALIQRTMQAEPQTITGKEVLVVDDILDSGWSVRECARSLKEAGARSVRVLAVTKTHAFVEETLGRFR